MHSIIICGGTNTSRKEVIKCFLPKNYTQNHPDVKILSITSIKRSIGIDEVRAVESFLTKKPLKSKENIVIVENAHFLTLQAQNALLKTLEEPPKGSKIILETQNEKKLLSTIISRCKRINLTQDIHLDFQDPTHNQHVKEFIELILSNKGTRLDFIDNIKSKISDKEYVINVLNIWQSALRDHTLLNLNHKSFILNKQNQNQITKLQLEVNKSIELIEYGEKLKNDINTSNVNTRLALELFLLKL